jgi:DNA-binding CsgD family transcriptional regulator
MLVVSGNGSPSVFASRIPQQSSRANLSTTATPGKLPLTVGEWQVISHYLGLSSRESEIARLIVDSANDLSEADIAAGLSMTRRTVHAHLERLYRKLGIHSRYQLVVRLFSAYLSSSRRSIE